MKQFVAITVFVASFFLSGLAQDRATMGPPIIRSDAEQVVISARFSDFVPGSQYRIGIGTVGAKLAAKLELLRDDQPVQKAPQDFVQGYAKNWWGVDQITVQGFVLSPGELEGGSSYTLRATIPRAAADQHQKLYLLVARNYGRDTWYMEDGTEIDREDW